MYQRNQKRWYKHFDFMLLDLLCMELSFCLAYVFRFGTDRMAELLPGTGQGAPYHRIMLMILALHIALVLFISPYSGILRRSAADEVKKVLQYNIYVFAGIVLMLFTGQSSDLYSRIVVFGFVAIDSILMVAYR